MVCQLQSVLNYDRKSQNLNLQKIDTLGRLKSNVDTFIKFIDDSQLGSDFGFF